MRSLVTGGAGFIGSHLIDRLVKRGDEVIVLDNVSSGKEEFLSHHSSQVTLHRVDITDYDAMSPYFEGVDVVFHFAANPDIRLGTQITDTDLKQGTLATYNVVESMRVHSVPTIMFASSSVVYGDNAPMPTPENHGPCLPISLYGASKNAGESLISSWVGTFGLQGYIFRFANIIGDRGTQTTSRDTRKGEELQMAAAVLGAWELLRGMFRDILDRQTQRSSLSLVRWP